MLLGLVLLGPTPGTADEPSAGSGLAGDSFQTRYQSWLEVVSPLISQQERDVFLALEENYQRDAFIRRFWQVRDPFPRTGHNEFRQRWEERLRLARERYRDPTEDRARMLVLVGEPDEKAQLACNRVVLPLEIWYFETRDEIGSAFYLVFWAQSRQGRYELWDSNQGLSLLHDNLMNPERKVKTTERVNEEQFVEHQNRTRRYDARLPAEPPERSPDLLPQETDFFDEIVLQCPRGELIVSALQLAIDPRLVRERFQPVPEPAEGWADRFFAHLATAGAEARRASAQELFSGLELEPRMDDEDQAFPRLAPVFVSPSPTTDEARPADASSTGGR